MAKGLMKIMGKENDEFWIRNSFQRIIRLHKIKNGTVW